MVKKMIDSKKALMALTSIVEIIIWVVGFLILFGVLFLLIDTGSDAAKESICRDSVMLRSKANIEFLWGVVERRHITPLLCDSIDKGELRGSRDEIKYQISELAAKCWWMFGEGRIDNIFNADMGESSCNVCYYFTIPKGMDEGELFEVPIFSEAGLGVRSDSLISFRELYNYMVLVDYNPKLLYGGGTKNYVGDAYKSRVDFVSVNNPREVRLSDVKQLPHNYVQDFSYYLDAVSLEKIRVFGNELLEREDSLLLVVVADKLRRNDRTDARRLIENLKMNSRKDMYDAFLVTISLSGEPSVRVHVGSALSNTIHEYEIQNMLETRFSSIRPDSSAYNFNNALQLFIEDLRSKLNLERMADYEEIIKPDSFYSYLSNDLENLVLIDDIESEKSYIIMYNSPSDKVGWFEGIFIDITESGGSISVATGIVTGVLVVASIVMTGGTSLLLLAAAGLTTTGVTIGAHQHFFDTDVVSGFQSLLGVSRGFKKNNNIIITRSAYGSLMCSDIRAN